MRYALILSALLCTGALAQDGQSERERYLQRLSDRCLAHGHQIDTPQYEACVRHTHELVQSCLRARNRQQQDYFLSFTERASRPGATVGSAADQADRRVGPRIQCDIPP